MIHCIEVKQEHIDKGIQASCSKCPVALAIAETGRKVFVAFGVAGIDKKTYKMSVGLRERIQNFDVERIMSPFYLALDDKEMVLGIGWKK